MYIRQTTCVCVYIYIIYMIYIMSVCQPTHSICLPVYMQNYLFIYFIYIFTHTHTHTRTSVECTLYIISVCQPTHSIIYYIYNGIILYIYNACLLAYAFNFSACLHVYVECIYLFLFIYLHTYTHTHTNTYVCRVYIEVFIQRSSCAHDYTASRLLYCQGSFFIYTVLTFMDQQNLSQKQQQGVSALIPLGTTLLGHGIDLIPISDTDKLRATEQVENPPSFQSLFCLSSDTDIT